MSQAVILSDALAAIAALVKAGDRRKAKRQAREILDSADAESLSVINWCASILENYPHETAILKLRNAWERANGHHRALIAACAPEEDNGQYRPAAELTTEPRYGRDNYRGPRNSRRRIDPSRRKAQRTQRQARQDAAAARYFAERAGIAEGQGLKDRDDRARDAQVYASGLDYDKAGLADTRGLPCVACWLERAATDTATDRVRAGHGDDGLCTDCRESGRPGIPELPAGHTLADEIGARCAFIVAHTGASARGILGREWQRAGRGSCRRDLISAWVQAHPLPETAAPTEQPAAQTAPATDGACTQCGGIRQVRHGLCLECRKLDSWPVLSAVPCAAANEPTGAQAEPASLAA
jgi:hypothetical protein